MTDKQNDERDDDVVPFNAEGHAEREREREAEEDSAADTSPAPRAATGSANKPPTDGVAKK